MNSEEPAPGERDGAQVEPLAAPGRRWLAAAVLVPTVPMLLLSILALGLFYAAPTRFGNLLTRLPGDDLIRSLLVFAPATLLAIVVLAVLYAVEKPLASEAGGVSAVPLRGLLAPQAGWWALGLSGLGTLASTAVWVFSFVAPGRFDTLLDRLPGETYLRFGVGIAPLAMLIVFLGSLFYALAARRADGRGLLRASAAAVLAPTLPLLLLSLGALAMFRFAPGRFAGLLGRLPEGSFVRLGLVFAPMALLAIAALALLYLWATAERPRALAPAASSSVATSGWVTGARETAALVVLVGGLLFTAALGVGLLAALALLVLR